MVRKGGGQYGLDAARRRIALSLRARGHLAMLPQMSPCSCCTDSFRRDVTGNFTPSSRLHLSLQQDAERAKMPEKASRVDFILQAVD
jgi:hypothetical protein